MCSKCDALDAYARKAIDEIHATMQAGQGIITAHEAVVILMQCATNIAQTNGVSVDETHEILSESWEFTNGAHVAERHSTLRTKH